MKTLDDKVKTEFEKNKYVKIPNGVSPVIIKFINNYITLFFDRYVKIIENLPRHFDYHNMIAYVPHGKFEDEKNSATGSFSQFGDMISEFLLLDMKESIGLQLGLELVPTYSYFRIYTKGNKLKRHRDRPSCEVSITMCLSRDGESWPIFIDGTPVHHDPGDLVVYRGCELEHWREPFKGTKQTQMFLHYNDKNGPYGEDNLYDGRPFLGLPGWTRNEN